MDQLSNRIQALSDADQFSGAVLIAHDHKPIFQKAYGLANHDFQIPNQINETKFNLASITKMFTAIAIAQLVERGQASYDDCLAHYIPEYPDKNAAQITIHHLLTHTSGLGNFGGKLYTSRRDSLRSVSDYLHLVMHEPPIEPPPTTEPGKQFYYSSAGYVVLGAIIERVSGCDYYEFLCRNIYEVADMEQAGHYELDRSIPNLAIGYTHKNWDESYHSEYWTNNLFLYPVKGGPHGCSYSTIADLYKFDIALHKNQLLSAEHTKQLLSKKVPAFQADEWYYGYGCYNRYGPWGRAVGHRGQILGADTYYFRYLETGHTVIVLSNYDRPAALTVVGYIEEALTLVPGAF